MKSKKPKGIKPYFIILKNCSDYKRLKKLGDILDINSTKYKNVFIESNKIFSSIYESWIYNPFKKDQKYLRDLFNYTIIFLKYDILMNDLSKYISNFHKNIYLIVTSSKKENKAIMSSNSKFNRSKIILTGMPKYDNLERQRKLIKNKKNILIIPILTNSFRNSKHKIFNHEKFLYKLTKCLEFYNRLINDKLLLLYMTNYNYTGTFCFPYWVDSKYFNFVENKKFSIIKNCDYEKLILKSSLLITDYSNSFFDFGYLKKPVIYTNFVLKNYKNNLNHITYFDYKKYGFGPICGNIQCIIREIIFELKNNCKLRKKYFQRIQKHFVYFDENNSQRLFDEITKVKQEVVKKDNNPNFLYISVFIFMVIIKFINFLII